MNSTYGLWTAYEVSLSLQVPYSETQILDSGGQAGYKFRKKCLNGHIQYDP